MKTSLYALAIAIAVTGTATAQQQPQTLIPSTQQIHQKLGAFVYPAKNQTPAQQTKDETECYTWAYHQTGIDPMQPGPKVEAVQAQQVKQDPAKGAAVKGAAGGAAAGAAVGAIAGDAGTGAAAGAAVGTMKGAKTKRQAKKQAEGKQEQANAQAAQATQQNQQQADAQRITTFKKAYSACVSGRGYSVQ